LATALIIDPMILVNVNENTVSYNQERIDRAVEKALSDVKKVTVDGREWSPIPIYGVIKAGTPSLASNEVLGYEFFDVDNSSEYFSLRVSGDSMCGARICDGDLVLIKKQPDAEDGEIVAVLIDGQDSTLKRIKYSATTLMFIADNPEYEPIVITYAQLKEDPDYVRILGVVKGLLVKF
jgi:repressor LexA